MTAPDDERRRLAAEYLRGRTLEEALAAWQADHASQPYWKRSPTLTRLGNVIRRLAAEAKVRDEDAADHSETRRRGRGRARRAPQP